MLAVAGDRISPVLDVARQFVLVEISGSREIERQDVRVENTDWVTKAKRIRELEPHALICGAITSALRTVLVSAGVGVIPNTCGRMEDVLAAFIEGKLPDQAFLMPGCSGQRQRLRRRSRGRASR